MKTFVTHTVYINDDGKIVVEEIDVNLNGASKVKEMKLYDLTAASILATKLRHACDMLIEKHGDMIDQQSGRRVIDVKLGAH